jgi:hypothetical protein
VRRAYRWLALLPAVGIFGGIFFANRVQPYVLGLPFLLAWLVVWVVLTSAIMGFIFLADRAADIADRAPDSAECGADAGDRRA